MRRPLSAVLVLSALPFSAHAAPTPRGHQTVNVVDNELFRSDPQQPRRLISKQPGTLTRAYIERMARPSLNPAILDELERVKPPAAQPQVLLDPEAPAFATAAISARDRVIILEGDALVSQVNGGLSFDHNGNGALSVIQQVLNAYGDNYDFVTVFTTFEDAGTAAYYFPLKNDIDGLGECNFNAGKTFGCLFDQTQGQLTTLDGFVFMNSLQYWNEWDANLDVSTSPITDYNNSVYAVLGQEVAHRWGSGLRFVDQRTDTVSNLLLGRDNSHWAAFVDTDASVMDGWDWVANDDGSFSLVDDMRRFSTLDLYTMGALPVAAAKPFFIIDDAVYKVTGDRIGVNNRAIGAADVLQMPSVALMDSIGMSVKASGTKVPVTIQDVVDAEGNRCPDPDATQKAFRQAVVLVTRPGQTIAQAEAAGFVEDLDAVLQTWEQWWLEHTNKRLKLCTELDGACVHAEQGLSGGLDVEGTSVQPGDTATVTLTVRAINADVENASIALAADGSGAEFLELPSTIDVGTVRAGQEKSVSFDVKLASDYPCGTSAIILATSSSDTAADVTEEIRFFPGLKTIDEQTFADGDNGFAVNVDKKDGTTDGDKGALRYTGKVELTCDMSQRTPERDISPNDDGAFLTGPGTDHVPNLLDDDAGDGAELDGDTSLWSSSYDLKDTVDPEFRFAYWLDGADGDTLRVQLSGDGEKTFLTASEITESFHGWVVGRVSVRDVFDTVPEKVSMRFIFEGGGTLEGGIDDVRLLDYDGACLEVARSSGVCGCNDNGEATPAAPVAMVLGLMGLRRLRRRR